ncbi:hypothetical protein [Lutispora sp.]|uniref:hypothetical protein n=1 Tax=Lutispora sp. TaxID=2828727 RepID=UPI003FA5879E
MVYLCAVIDLYNNQPVAWNISDTQDKNLSIDAIKILSKKYNKLTVPLVITHLHHNHVLQRIHHNKMHYLHKCSNCIVVLLVSHILHT